MASVDDYPTAHRAQLIEELTGWLRPRSVAGLPEHDADLPAHRLDAPVLFFGTGLPEGCWHDSDESVSVDVLAAGAATLAGF